MTMDETQADVQTFRSQMRRAVEDLGLRPPPSPSKVETVRNRRRVRGAPRRQRAGMMTIVERDGILELEEGLPPRQAGARRRRSAHALGLGAKIVDEVPFEQLEGEKIGEAIQKLDSRLTPFSGLRRLKGNALVPEPHPRKSGRILLFVHGTFSNNDRLIEELQATKEGAAFLGKALAHYDQVLTFDHPTLAVSPMLNARKLALTMGASAAHVDVICHSRGGLVTRWWLEAFDHAPADRRRVIFVASPLAGTGLAAPPNLRASINLLANIGRALGAASAAVPFLQVATGLFQVLSSVTRFVAKTPAIDAAVALVPGLRAMSRVGNNAEILSLRQPLALLKGRYFAVQSNFEPEDPGWRFWRYFRDVKGRAADLAADVIFDGANDLVVDTSSMTDLAPQLRLPGSQVRDFGKNSTVHHVNYFSQGPAVKFFRDKLGVG